MLEPELKLLLDLLVSSGATPSRADSRWTSAQAKEVPLPSTAMLVLGVQIFSCSVWVGRPPPGAALMNLQYRDERSSGSATVSEQRKQQAPQISATRAPGDLVCTCLVGVLVLWVLLVVCCGWCTWTRQTGPNWRFVLGQPYDAGGGAHRSGGPRADARSEDSIRPADPAAVHVDAGRQRLRTGSGEVLQN